MNTPSTDNLMEWLAFLKTDYAGSAQDSCYLALEMALEQIDEYYGFGFIPWPEQYRTPHRETI